MHFTGKQRDYESNLDFFGARYFGGGNNLGRFMTPDPSGRDAANPSNPQTWNLYAYAGNNPTTNTDPTGEACVQGSAGNYFDDNSGGQTCAQVDADNAQQKPSVTVSGAGISDGDYLAAMAVGAQRAGPVVNGAALATGGVMIGAGGAMLYGAITGGTGLITLGIASGPLIGGRKGSGTFFLIRNDAAECQNGQS